MDKRLFFLVKGTGVFGVNCTYKQRKKLYILNQSAGLKLIFRADNSESGLSIPGVVIDGVSLLLIAGTSGVPPLL